MRPLVPGREAPRDNLSVLRNFSFPTRKLLSTFRSHGKSYKTYDQPQTPFQRLMISSHISEEVKKNLRCSCRSSN